MKTLFLFCLLLPNIAFASVAITDGNVKQEDCGFTSAINARHSWDVRRGGTSVEVSLANKLSPVGKVVFKGDALFFAHIVSQFRDKVKSGVWPFCSSQAASFC